MFRFGFARCPLDGTPLQKLSDDPLAGSLFADRYVIEACIGEGGMGRVYRARHQRVSRRFAIKVLYGDHAADPKMRERFAREAEAASRLDHRNVISVVDFGETDEGLLYLVMDFVEGRELAEVIDDEGPLDAARVERFVRQLCAGLAHAHDKGLVHRDFKPENVIVTGEGDEETARIVDFGIAVMAEGDDKRLTTEGLVLGTPAYMSPEQATGAELDHRTDLFSLGVLVYEMLAGVLPFEGPPLAIARQNLGVEPPAISERVPGLQVAPGLEAVAMRLMAKVPEHRFESARDVIAELDRRTAAAAAATTVRPPALAPVPVDGGALDTSDMQAIAPVRRLPFVRVVAGVVAAGAVVAVVFATRGGGDANSHSSAAPPATDARAQQPPPADAGSVGDATVAEASVDAGVATADAARARMARRQPGVRPHKRRQPRPVRSRPDAGARRVVRKRPADARRRPAVTAATVSNRYVKVGQLLKRLETQKGKAVASPYQHTYLRLPPLADTLRTPALMADVDGKLRRLQSRILRALRN